MFGFGKAKKSDEKEQLRNVMSEAFDKITKEMDTQKNVKKEFSVGGYIKRPENEDYEPVVLTSGKQIRSLLGIAEGKPSQQIHTSKGFSVYANPEAEGDCVGHTVRNAGDMMFWKGTFVVAKYSNGNLVNMDDFDLAVFLSEVMDKVENTVPESEKVFTTSVEALQESSKYAKLEEGEE